MYPNMTPVIYGLNLFHGLKYIFSISSFVPKGVAGQSLTMANIIGTKHDPSRSIPRKIEIMINNLSTH